VESHHHHHHSYNRAFALGVGLNVAYVALEAGFGLWSGSLALLADAAHNLGDVAGLLLAWAAASLATLRPTRRRTYGFGRITMLASLVSSLLLLVTMGAMAWEALERLREPREIPGLVVVWVAGAGVVINGLTAALFLRGSQHDLNIRAAFLHMAADAAVSGGVVVAALAMMATGWLWLDPAVSIVIAILIVVSTWELLRDSAGLLLDVVPRDIDPVSVREVLGSHPGVADVHDLHIWALSTREVALTAHLVVRTAGDPQLLAWCQQVLAERFDIHHITVQLEPEDGGWDCPLVAVHAI